MFSFLRRISDRLIHKSTHIAREPLNKASTIVILLIDLFVIINVFNGLNSISQWPLSPAEEFACFSAYQNYYQSPNKDSLDFQAKIIANAIEVNPKNTIDSNRLGKQSALCSEILQTEKSLNNAENIKTKKAIENLRWDISRLENENLTLKNQYDSTLLEKIAGQNPKNSINKTTADRLKTTIDRHKNTIATKTIQIAEKQKQLIQQSDSANYLKQLQNSDRYQLLQREYDSASFWYPNKQLILQALFLLPLITIAYLCHSWSERQNKGLLSLLSWHLLLLFCLPLLIKFFEFLQFGNLVKVGIEFITAILGGLIFISSYLLILIIPLSGFALIKFLQAFIFNPKIQAKNRIEKLHCINCNFKLRTTDIFCSNCGFDQFVTCSNCQNKTYKFLGFCRHCGHEL
jgi:hypothetical protein